MVTQWRLHDHLGGGDGDSDRCGFVRRLRSYFGDSGVCVLSWLGSP